MIDLTRFCQTCNQYLKLNEQMRHQPVRCPMCKGVLMPDVAPPTQPAPAPAPVPNSAPLPDYLLDHPPPRPAPRPQPQIQPPPKQAAPHQKAPPPKNAVTRPRPPAAPVEEDEPTVTRRSARSNDQGEIVQSKPPRSQPRSEEVRPPARRKPAREEPEAPDGESRRRPKADDPAIVRGRRLTRSEDDDEDDQPARIHRDDVPQDVMERARAISLKLKDLPSAVREKIKDELADREQVVWIGRHYGPFVLIRSLWYLFSCFLGLLLAGVFALVAFGSGGQAGLLAGGIALFVALVAGLMILIRLLRAFLWGSTYVLTSRRAIVIAWSIFGGYYATAYGPELAACPRIRRGLIMRNCGDLVMMTLIKTKTTHYLRSGNVRVRRTRTFFGFIGIRNVDEVDRLCADTLGHYLKELVRPTAYWDLYDVMRWAGWAAVPVGLFTFCVFACGGYFFPSWFATEPEYAKKAWLVQPDPGTRPPAESAPAKQPIALGDNKVFYPHSPSPYVAVGAGKNKQGQPRIQIYDLARWEKMGPLQNTELEDGKRLALSPDGKLFATRFRGKPLTMQYSGPFMPNVVNFDVNSEPGWVIDQVEFANNQRIVIMAKKGEDAAEDSEMRFMVYDVGNRKNPDTVGATPRQFHPRYASFSAGGNYLAMVIKGKERLLAFWDLREGNPCGAIRLDEDGEPGGVAFSPDGQTVALLLKTAKGGGEWGRLVCWNLGDRAKVHSHVIAPGPAIDPVESLHLEGGKKALAWLPDGKGWLLFGHVVIDRDTGAVVGEVKPQKGREKEAAERVFRGNGEVTDLDAVGRALGVAALPKR